MLDLSNTLFSSCGDTIAQPHVLPTTNAYKDPNTDPTSFDIDDTPAQGYLDIAYTEDSMDIVVTSMSDVEQHDPSSTSRKSCRVSTTPIWMRDYVTQSKRKAHSCYLISNCVSYVSVSHSLSNTLNGLFCYS